MSTSLPTDLDRIALVKQLETVSPEIADWAERQLCDGQTVEQIKERLRRVMRIAAPLRSAEQPIGDQVSRIDTEFNLNWADANPELFAQAVRAFQTKTPVTHWAHHVDLSRECYITLIAVRRAQPFDSVKDYLADDKRYLRETGFNV